LEATREMDTIRKIQNTKPIAVTTVRSVECSLTFPETLMT
jgi:hypothetical protein